MKANLWPGGNLATASVAELIGKGGRVESLGGVLPCFSAGITVLFLPVYGTNRPRPAWISSRYSTAVRDCVGFHLCSPLKVMNLIKYTAMLAELSLLERSWYPSQLAQSWGAQQSAGEKG